jgi:multidrug resistance efflux pump
MKNYISIFSVLIILLINFGCHSTTKKKIAIMTIKKGIFEITISGFGELNAVKATQVKVPTKARGSQIIVWLASENSIVEKGDVLIRFDGTNYRERIKTENYNLAKLDLELKNQEIELKKEKSNLEGELKVIAIEKEIAKNYGAKDETIFSRNEIIDAEVNLKFLNTKMTHLKDKILEFKKKAGAELQLLRLKKKTVLVKLQQYKDTLDALEVKAPHNGLFVYQKNWRGEKPRIGSRVWTGMKIGKLPDLSIMEAKIFILESEASGLKSNLVCSIVLDSHPQKTFMGKVKGVELTQLQKQLKKTVLLNILKPELV